MTTGATPTAPATPTGDPGATPPFMPASLASCPILIIDDSDPIRSLLTGVLTDAGLRDIRATGDPIKGLEMFEQSPPDLVFLDLHMPVLDGFEVLRRLQPLRRSDAPVPVVMLTGDGDRSSRMQALALGASDFLNKPFYGNEVLLRVRALLETRSLQLRLAQQNKELEARVAERTGELEASQWEVLQRLAAAAELRDDATDQHTQRVGRLSGQLAVALGLDPDRAAMIARAAPLHDIGKIGVADAILRKPGKLTDDEFAVMTKHAALGARLLSGGHSEPIQLAERIALSHHERWDGTGYPNRVAAAAIPLEARIVAVVDVFDALTHDRPYRGAVQVERTLTMIRESVGSHFDPTVAEAFIGMVAGAGGGGGRHHPAV